MNVSVNAEDMKMDEMINELKKAGLITGDNVSLEIKDGKVIINGKELSEDVAKQFSMYLEEKDVVNIKVDLKEEKK